VDFSRGWPRDFFRGTNGGEISFYKLETKRKHFSSEKAPGK